MCNNVQKENWLFEKIGVESWRTSDEYDTKEEAIAAGREYFMENLDDLGIDEEQLKNGANPKFEVGRQSPVAYGINGDSIIEQLNEDVYSEVGEVAEQWPDASKEKVAELERMMNATLYEWIEKHDLHPRFYTIVDTEEVPLVPIAEEEQVNE